MRINLDEASNGQWSLMAITFDGQSSDRTLLLPPGLPRNQWFYMIITQNKTTHSFTITLQVDNETYTVVIYSHNTEDLKYSTLDIGYPLNKAPYVLAFNC
ncbi:unnamed protein product [Meganyctiphanes norvegica]|uniref:Uncharacterized protein n=1 Tax=Meganyctiphanes norvegica TaxID=48144 RepID=A0AAV2RU08_MEGNR